jgi:D-methionine transport system substrate-binding protein
MKKTIAIILTLVLALSLVACGGGNAAADKKITVAASPTPHAEILKVAQEVLAKEGWTLEITEYADYVVPNNVVEDGEIDANYFQHVPYLDTFNAENGTHLVSVAMVHYEPFGIYAGTKSAVADLAEGDKIAIPNDGSNRARALLLLEQEGIIKLAEGVGMEATVLDIAENALNLTIVEMEAAQIAGVRDSVALAVINGNYALLAGLNAGVDALAVEDAESISATTYANILVVKEGNEKTEKTLALIAAVTSEEVKAYINETYSGAVVPIF